MLFKFLFKISDYLFFGPGDVAVGVVDVLTFVFGVSEELFGKVFIVEVVGYVGDDVAAEECGAGGSDFFLSFCFLAANDYVVGSFIVGGFCCVGGGGGSHCVEEEGDSIC